MDKNTNPWKVKTSRNVYESDWIKVEKNDVIKPNGSDGEYSVVHFKNLAIGIIPLDDDYFTWIVGQFRFPINTFSWEIPEGGGSLEIPPIESAKRELLEETGIVAEDYVELLKMHLSNSATDELAILFIAKKLSFQQACPDDTEVLTVKKIHLNEAFKMCMNGEITDAMSVAGILKAYHLYEKGII